MRLDQMKSYLVLASSSSISEAARKLYISHQGMTKSLNALEAEIGERLVDRSFDGIKLTDAGIVVARHCEQFLAVYDNMQRALLETHANTEQAPISELLVTKYTSAALLDSIDSSSFNTVLEKPFDTLKKQIRTPTDSLFALDIVCNSAPDETLPESCRFVPLFRTELGLILPSSSPLANELIVSARTAASIPLAIVEDETVDTIASRIFDGLSINAVLKTTSAAAYRKKIKCGQAAGLLDSFTFEKSLKRMDDADEFAFIPLSTPWHVVIGLAYREDSVFSEKLRYAAGMLSLQFRSENAEYERKHPLGLLQGRT